MFENIPQDHHSFSNKNLTLEQFQRLLSLIQDPPVTVSSSQLANLTHQCNKLISAESPKGTKVNYFTLAA